MGSLNMRKNQQPCSCGAYTVRRHNEKLSDVPQVRGKDVPKSKPHKYTGPK